MLKVQYCRYEKHSAKHCILLVKIINTETKRKEIGKNATRGREGSPYVLYCFKIFFFF